MSIAGRMHVSCARAPTSLTRIAAHHGCYARVARVQSQIGVDVRQGAARTGAGCAAADLFERPDGFLQHAGGQRVRTHMGAAEATSKQSTATPGVTGQETLMKWYDSARHGAARHGRCEATAVP